LLSHQNLDQIFTIQEFRHLSKNLTFQYKNTVYQIQTERETYALRNARVVIREKEDGSIEVFYHNKILVFTVHHYQEKQREVIDSKQLNETIDKIQRSNQPKHKPSCHHPWKRGLKKKRLKDLMAM
jgi:hypothetical protein